MGKISHKLLNGLTKFMLNEIHDTVLDGVTYALLTNSQNDTVRYNEYKEIKKEAINCGFRNDEVFRIYTVSNGHILDMDIGIAKKIANEIVKSVAKTSNDEELLRIVNEEPERAIDLFQSRPENRRQVDISRLVKYIQEQYKNGNGNKVLEVALFNRNKVPRIKVSGVTKTGESVTLTYNSYAIRHWDMEEINKDYLIPSGLRIATIETCEILPSKTGVRFKLYIESI